jgi:hypothetical protein
MALYLPAKYLKEALCFWRTQCDPEDVPENLNLLLLAQDVLGHQQTQELLLAVPATKIRNKKTLWVWLPMPDKPNL